MGNSVEYISYYCELFSNS